MSLFNTNRVLVPNDFSEVSFQAQQLTLEFVGEASRLYVIHVLPHLNSGEPGIFWETTDEESRKEYMIQKFWERYPQLAAQGLHFQVTVGDPSSEIINYANQENIDLIVIPSHGRTGLGHFFLGSVAEKVIRHAHCPVLVLRRDHLHLL
jgi:nucleotide-binding universal stress UspA family protein